MNNIMTRPTDEADTKQIETADDLDDLVQDRRQGWQANVSEARCRVIRCKKRLTNELLKMDYSDEELKNVEGASRKFKFGWG